MAVELGDVIAVLLDPPPYGHAVLRQQEDEGVSELEAWFVAARAERNRPVQWRVRDSRQGVSVSEDGIKRHFHEGRQVEVSEGRPDYVPPCLHLLFPLHGFFWGRPGDDWRMRSDVRSEGDLARVRLTNLDDPVWEAQLVVDLQRRLAVTYARPGSVLSLVAFDDRFPEVPFDRL